MSVEIKYKGNTIASANTEITKTIKTSGQYCEADIEVINTQDGGDAPVINPLSVTANGTYTAPSGVDGYSPVTVNVPQGITPTGNINITDTNVTDVTNYATAQVVSENLKPENIKKDIDILGIIGTFAGGGGGGLPKIGTVATNPTEGTYGRLEIPANDGIYLCTNVSVTPDNSNRLPFAVICYVDTTTPTQSAAMLGYNYGGSSISVNNSGQANNIAYYNGSSAYRFSTSATYDLYKLY